MKSIIRIEQNGIQPGGIAIRLWCGGPNIALLIANFIEHTKRAESEGWRATGPITVTLETREAPSLETIAFIQEWFNDPLPFLPV